MKKLVITLLLVTGMSASIWTLDFRTDAACNDLKVAIEQGRPSEQVKAQFESLLVAVQLSTAEQADLVDQVITYANEQKKLVQMILVVVGNNIYYDRSIILAAAGMYCIKMVRDATRIFLRKRSQGSDIEDSIAYMTDALSLSDTIWHKYLNPGDNKSPLFDQRARWLRLLGITEFGFYGVFGIYLFYKSATHLYQCYNQKKLLEAKLANLDETIRYFEKLVTNNNILQKQAHEIT